MILYKKGSRGEGVKQIQIALHLYPDGIFGTLTEEAVKEFQKEHNLTIDGIVGPNTFNVLTNGSQLKKSKRRINSIIVHCSATPEGRDYTVEQIKKDHKEQGWSDIGYHYVIYRDGSIHEGRNVDIIGAHCEGHNSNSIGVCYIGGLENKPNVEYKKLKAKDTRTEAQKRALIDLLSKLKKYYPEAKIYGHHDFNKGKDCPSFDAKNEYKNL
jgi:N-acetylmuramoyl-L-alanine amidase